MVFITVEELYNEYNNGLSVPMLAAKYGLSKHVLYDRFKEAGYKLRNHHDKNVKQGTCDENYFDKIDNQDKAYWLGFLSADGYITSKQHGCSQSLGLSLSVSDIGHLEKFSQCIHSTYKIHVYKVKQGYKPGVEYCRILIPNQHMVDTLKSYGVVENKTSKLTPAKVPDEFVKDYIRGLFDGDGCLSMYTTSKKVPQYSCEFLATDSVLDFITDELISVGIIDRKHYYDRRKPNQPVAAFKLGGNNLAYKTASYLYKDANMYLDRKYQRYKDLEQLINSRS